MKDKRKIDISSLQLWKDKILNILKDKITSLTSFKKRFRTCPTLKNKNVLEYLEELQKKFVIAPIDKASNNISFICKRYYIEKLLHEVGIFGSPSDTYQLSAHDPKNIIIDNIKLCNKFDLDVNEKQQELPFMYWLPKKHKQPCGARFIVASSSCSTKPLSKIISKIFKLIYTQIENFHSKSKFYSNYNLFWVVNNSKNIIDKLNSINSRSSAKCISTYDFSTLYTKIPHKDLINQLNKIIDLAFKGGNKKYISCNNYNAFWCNSNKGKTVFSKQSLKQVVEHLICKSYFQIGNKLLVQNIGIPMGIDPAPFWANLYLHRLEYDYMISLIKTNNSIAYKFNGCRRFIDDQCCINDSGEFGKSYKYIYPEELELKCEHQGTHATFLDIDISIDDGLFVYKQYDKRDSFPFDIVRMPHKNSNIPSNIFYSSILSEFLRLARTTLKFQDFFPRVTSLAERMINQGGNCHKILRQFKKAMCRHPDPFSSFSMSMNDVLEMIKKQLYLRCGGT